MQIEIFLWNVRCFYECIMYNFYGCKMFPVLYCAHYLGADLTDFNRTCFWIGIHTIVPAIFVSRHLQCTYVVGINEIKMTGTRVQLKPHLFWHMLHTWKTWRRGRALIATLSPPFWYYWSSSGCIFLHLCIGTVEFTLNAKLWFA